MVNKKDTFNIGFWNYVDAGVLPEKESVSLWNDLGMTLAMSFEYKKAEDKDCILKLLDECEKYNIKLIVCDYRTRWDNLKENKEEKFIEDVKDAVKDFGNHPAFYAFHVGDEPGKEEFPIAKQAVSIVSRYSKPFINFYPMWKYENFKDMVGVAQEEYGSYLVQFSKETGLPMLSYDCYNQCHALRAEEGLNSYFENLNLFREAGKKAGVPMWTSLLSVGHWDYRVPTADDIRWQISTAVAHGAKGLLWFFIYERTYASSYRYSPIDLYNNKTYMYDFLSRENKIFRDFYGDMFVNANLKNVFHYGKTYGGTSEYKDGCIKDFKFSLFQERPMIISLFEDNGEEFVVIVNNSQSEVTRVDGEYKGEKFTEWLAPGQMYVTKQEKR